MSPRASRVCEICPAVTWGRYCTRHRTMTDAERAAEGREIKRRGDRFMALWEEARRLRREEADEADVAAAEELAEKARLHLAELFGDSNDESE